MSDRASWVTVRVHPGADVEAVTAALFEAGAQGVQELGDALVTHVPDMDTANALLCAALAASPAARVETEPLPDVDWSEQWKRGIGAQRLGALTVAPPWLAEGLDPAASIIIEPAMAFGTGEHATTRGVVRLLQSVIHNGDRVADLGAGSAVLSIAAAKLGAAHVAAIELDHDAIANAEENVARNGVADRVVVIEGDAAVLLPLVAPVRVITANIISSVLKELLPVMRDALAPGGAAILSGILRDERPEMLEALEAGGWRIVAEDSEDAWWSATIARR
ncbi:MAG TPA: 50S ribosomal protein L11 methyltransferase [Gemmatimonadaceae bacterium]|nr:50S ribosomal protein L11 methyltransferase [Gemmatimonadaceae bacterium]